MRGEVELGTAWWEEKQQGGIYVRIWPRCSKEESNSSGLDGHIKGTSSRTDVRAGTRYAALVAVTEERRVDVTLAVARLVWCRRSVCTSAPRRCPSCRNGTSKAVEERGDRCRKAVEKRGKRC